MGCETSKQENNDIVSIVTEEDEFRISYRELVTQDRGQVFQLYHFSTIINRSNYSIVRNVVSRASQQNRICKIIPLTKKRYFTVVSQVQYLKKLDHPNIIQIIQYFLQPTFLYIILQQLPGDRILRQLHKINEGVIFEVIVQIIKQLLRVIEFCHSKQIAHRAITTENILLFFRQKKPFLKLIDFSQACTIGCPNPIPVSLQKRNVFLSQSQQNQTDKIDIYDCGIVIYSLIKGMKVRVPHLYVNYQQIIQKAIQTIKQVNLGSKVQKDLIGLLTKMLDKNPYNRPTAIQCLNHPFFSNFNKTITSKKALTCLMRFQPQNNLKYLLSMYASLNMTSSIEKAQYLSQFYNLDKDKDGQIQLQELAEGIKNTFNFQHDKAKQYAQELFENLDKNKSGSINFSEYITGTVKLSKLISNDFLQRMFKQIDMNHDGLVTQAEVNNLILGINRYNVLQGQRQVNFNQFKQMMLKIIQKQNGFKVQ